MSLNDYFDPVSLEKPDDEILKDKSLFCRHIYIHTQDNPIPSLKDFKVAIIGVPEGRGNKNEDVELSPDIVRDKLYQLVYFEKKLPIIDLGNLKKGKETKDTYYGLRDVLLELFSENILPIIIGGSQDITYGVFLALEYLKKPYILTTIDYKIDLAFESYDKITSKNYLNTILLESQHLFEYFNIGQQACYTTEDNASLFENLFHESIRLGLLRNNILVTEPYLRDSSVLSIDFSAIKHADAPGQAVASPNGFNSEDLCQMARFAGFGEGLKVLGLFDFSPFQDHNNTTSSLAAQVIWYFLEGFSHKINELPTEHPEEFKKFIISYDETNTLTFYKSLLSNRWWCEVPGTDSKSRIIACSEIDYLNATKLEIPDRWLKILKKIN
jgi:arginase family enzyme